MVLIQVVLEPSKGVRIWFNNNSLLLKYIRLDFTIKLTLSPSTLKFKSFLSFFLSRTRDRAVKDKNAFSLRISQKKELIVLKNALYSTKVETTVQKIKSSEQKNKRTFRSIERRYVNYVVLIES